MSAITFKTISDLPTELLYTILSHRLADLLFDYLFVDTLTGLTNNKDAEREGEDREEDDQDESESASVRPITAVHPAKNTLVEIGSLGGVCVAWHIVLTRILRAVVNLNLNLDDHAQSLVTASHLIRRCHAHPPSPSPTLSLDAFATHDGSLTINGFPQASRLGPLPNSHTSVIPLVHGVRDCCQTLSDMQTSLRKLVQQTTDRYRFEQQLNSAGVTTPTLMAMGPITPPPALPSTSSLDQSNPNFLSNLIHSLGSQNAHFQYHTSPIFQSALYYTQASLLASPNNSGRRQDLSLTLSTANLTNALRLLRINPTVHAICPREVASVVKIGTRETEARLERALEVCEWKDLLERVFLRGDRGEEVTQRIHHCFERMEQESESLDLHHLVRGGLYRIVQLISRLDSISLESETNNTTTSSDGDGDGDWNERASALTYCWTGRVIEWSGF